MGVQPTTAEAILQGARRAIAERGTGRLTMSAVAEAAGISRPTLYRHYPTKDSLLDAISAYEERQFDIGLKAVIDAHRAPRRRLDAALRYVVSYMDESMSTDPIGADPAFALKASAASLPPHARTLARLLGDALLEVPAVRSGAITTEQAAELFLRLAYSHYLVPHPDSDVLLSTMLDLAGVTRRRARAVAG